MSAPLLDTPRVTEAPASAPPLDVAIAGTRGVPANYSGFETFAEELGARLVERGHRVTVSGLFIAPWCQHAPVRSLRCISLHAWQLAV